MPINLFFLVIALNFFATPTLSQVCISSEVIFSDLTQDNAAFTTQISTSESLVINEQGTFLTNTSSNGYGGFFFITPIDLSGPGGFSTKFVLQSTDTSAGVSDAWEFILASSSNLDLEPPPYSSGSASSTLSGWSRSNAFVVEFDAYNSGSLEEDDSTNHIAVFLSGEKICSQDVAFSFASSAKYTIWVDYSGFATQAFIRVSDPDGDTRPVNPTMTCDLDIWASMDINSDNHVGFFAYNNPDASGGAEHRLVDVLAIADSYNPIDGDTCAIYANCVQKTIDAQCLMELASDSSKCTINDCTPGYVWDVSGTDCCAFVEKETKILSSTAGVGPFPNGAEVDCESVQRTIATLTDSGNCT